MSECSTLARREQRCSQSERTVCTREVHPGESEHECCVAAMLITLCIEKTQPLTGTATGSGEHTVAFLGWLDLLRAVSELTAAAQPDEQGRLWDTESLERVPVEWDR